MGKYESSSDLLELGIISGEDITVEAALAKAMFVLAVVTNREERIHLMKTPLRGEMTA
jgi:L-asparaginase